VPTSQDDTTLLIQRISEQSRLYTTECLVHKIVTHDDVLRLQGSILGMKYDHALDLGDRKIAIPIDVTLKAYIDFSSFDEGNVEKKDGFIHITLPDPEVEVTASKVEHKQVRQYTGFLRSRYSDSEMSDFTRQGVESIIQSLPEMGLIQKARENAATLLMPIIQRMGYEADHIVITFRNDLEKTSPVPTPMEGGTILLNYPHNPKKAQ